MKIRVQLAVSFVFLWVPSPAHALAKASRNGLVYPNTEVFDEGFYRKLCGKEYEADSVSICLDRYRQLTEYVKTRITAKKKEKNRIKERILALGYEAREFEELYGESGKPVFDRLERLMKKKDKSVLLLTELDAETEILEQAEVGILRARLLKRLVKFPVPTVTPEAMQALSQAAEDSLSLRGKFTDTSDAEIFFAYNLFLNNSTNAIATPGYENRVLSNQALALELLLMRVENGKDTLRSLEEALDSMASLKPAALDLVFWCNLVFAFTAEKIGYLAADYFEGYWEHKERNPATDGKTPARIPSASFRKKCQPVLAAFEAYHRTDSGPYRALTRVLSDPRGLAPQK